jgi:hypothetical protein
LQGFVPLGPIKEEGDPCAGPEQDRRADKVQKFQREIERHRLALKAP